MSHSINEIARALGCEVVGDGDLTITRVAEPKDAGPDELALAMKPAFAETLSEGRAKAAMLWQGADWQALGLTAAILAPRPRHALAGLSAMLDTGPGYPSGIHPTAIIDDTAEIGDDVSIGAFTIVAAGARIGDGSVIGPQCYIGSNSVLGARAWLREQIVISHGCTIGDGFICHAGAKIGADGFSFVTPEESAIERVRGTLGDQGALDQQSYARIHSLGGVTIADNVEIGANCNVDRGTVRDTFIGPGSKIDSLAMIGHNARIGRDTLICAQVGIAGSTVIGNNCVLGGQSGVGDNLIVGDNVISGGATKILANVPSGRVMLGYPATQMDGQLASYKALRRLPRLFRDVATLKKAVSNLRESD